MFPGEQTFIHLFRKISHQEPWGHDLAPLLLPALAAPYQAGARIRRGLYQKGWLASQRLPAPVVSVGNLVVGGTGKTPVTACLARFFQARRQRVAILSRGYGGRRSETTCLSDGERLYHKPPEVGEEAFELAQSLPGVLVYTGPCRYTAGMAAWRDHRPDIFLLDDGFQHFQLARDLDIVLLDADRPFGNGRLLPAGPLREPLSTLREADILILTRYEETRHRDRLGFLSRLFPLQDIFTAVIESTSVKCYPGGEEHPPAALDRLAALAFAGLARPRAFQDSLTALGVNLRGFRAFPDHYVFTPDDLFEVSREARRQGAQALVTTAKDWARMGQIWPGDLPLWVLSVTARVDPEEDFQKCLAAALKELPGPEIRKAAPLTGRPEAPQPLPARVHRRFQQLIRVGPAPSRARNIQRILVRAPNWVGDAVMSLPVLAGLTRLFPPARISVLAVPRVAPLYPGQPGVAEVLPYPAGWEKWRTLLDLRNKFDLALALPNSFESALGLWLTRTPQRLGYAANGRSALLSRVLKGKERLRSLHQVYYYLGLLAALGPVGNYVPPGISLSETEITAGKSFLMAEGLDPERPWVGLAPGAAYGPAKRWPPERFAAVGELLQEEFQAGLVLLGGPADREAAALVQSFSRGRFLNLAGKTTLRQALTVLSQLKVLITNDSGLMHAAAALGVPVVAIFGSTDPAATGPFTSRATVIHRHLPCSPCLKRTCSLNYACLEEISVAEVAEAARDWLR